MTKAYSYIRMSTEIQLRGDSLRRQLEMSRNYATKHGLELVDTLDGKPLHDIGVSGYRGLNRTEGALGGFIDALNDGQIEKGSYLLVESLDRLSRESISKAMVQFMSLIEKGLVVVTLTDGAVYSKENVDQNPGMLFISMGAMARAHDESHIKSKRLSSAWENKRKNISTKPITSIVPKWMALDKASNKIILDTERIKVVKEIFRLCANSYGIDRIVKHLNRNETAVFGRAKLWGRSYISKILNSRAVLGEYQPHIVKNGRREAIGQPIENYYPAVISEQEFINAQAAMERRKIATRGRKGPTFGNVFTGLMYCKHCNQKMQYRDKGKSKKGGQYLICKDKLSGGSCKSPDWRIDEVETLVFRHLKEIDLGSMVTKRENKLGVLDKKISNVKYEITQFGNKKTRAVQNLIDLDLDGDSKKQLSEAIGSLNASLISKEKELAELVIEKTSYLEATSLQTTQGLKNFIDVYEKNSLNYEFKSEVNELLRRAIDRIEMKQTQYGIDPTEYDENSSEVMSYRKRSKKSASAKLEVILKRETFAHHCEWLSREMYVYYKAGSMRYISFADGFSVNIKPTRITPTNRYTKFGD